MPVTSCLEFSGSTRAVPQISPVKTSWLCWDISKHLTQTNVSCVSHPSPVKRGNQTVPTLGVCSQMGLVVGFFTCEIVHISNFHLSQAIPDKSFGDETKQLSKPEIPFPKSLALKQQEGEVSVK